MKIDLANLRPSSLEIPEQVASLLERLKRAETLDSLVDEMKTLKEWPTLHGKSELVRWAPVLNRLDEMLELGTKQTDHKLAVDTDNNVKSMVEVALKFSAQVFENTTSRSSYASVDRLLALMESSDPRIIIEVLLVFQVMGKRSRFLSNRLTPDLQKKLVGKLSALTECWGGRVREVKLDECIKPSLVLSQPLFPFSFTNTSGQTVQIAKPDDSEPLLRVVEETLKKFDGDEADRASLLSRIRLLRHFDDQTHRVDWLIARLLAMSTLLYSRCGSDEMQSTLQLPPPGFIEQTCSLLHLDDSVHERMDMIKSEALRTLTAICSTETKPHRIDSNAIRRRLVTIMEQLGATSYHGFLATYVRDCVDDLKKGNIGKPGHPSVGLCTALFSLLYHMASLDHPRRTGQPAQDTLISSGITQTMLSVISFHDLPIEYTSFVTRCVRVIDVVSALDVQGFISNKGMETCVNRLCFEVDECKKEHAYMIDIEPDSESTPVPAHIRTPKQTTFCHHQRGALIKSLLNFIKRIINERDFVEQVRQVMEYGLPDALRHIFSNVDYYSSALFHYSMQLVQNFIYQEPVQLTMLQNHHVPYTLLMAMLRKDIEPTRDVIATMAQVFSAFCLNERGIAQFKKFKPFDEMLRVVLTAKYINTMKRRRGDLMDDCSYNVGSTLDDLLRQHNTLRELCLDSFIAMLQRLISLGTDPQPAGIKMVMTLQKLSRGLMSLQHSERQEFMMRDMPRGDSLGVMSPREEMEASDEEEIDPASVEAAENMDASTSSPTTPEAMTITEEEKRKRDIFDMTTLDSSGQRVLPLGDYLCILTRIIEVILASTPVADIVEGLVSRGGVAMLLQSMNLPHLRMELAASNYPNVVSSIIRHAVGGQPNVVQRHPVPNAAPVRDEVVQQLVAWATESLSPITKLAARDEQREGLSLLCALVTGDVEADYATAASMTANVLNVTTMLIGVTKCASIVSSNRENDLRSKVISMWTEEGSELHSMLHRIANVFSWEHGLMTAMRAHTKLKRTSMAEKAEMETARSRSLSPSEAGDANDGDSMRAMADAGSDASIESVDVEMMPSTSTAVEDGVSKAEREWKASVALSMGMSRPEFDFYTNVYKKGDFPKQFYKALRSVQELLSCFSRVCIGNTTRARRGGAYDASMPYNLTKNAQKLASGIFSEYYKDLEFSPIGDKNTNPIMPFYLSDMLGNLTPLLMDEKKHQFHHLIAKFYTSGCYKSVFSVMTDYLVPALLEKRMSIGHELVFTEWCKLITGMSNRQGLLQSRYKMVEAQAKLFPTNKYYTLLQTDIFNALHALVPVLQMGGSQSLAAKPVLTEMIFKLLSDVTRNLAELREEEIELNGVAAGERVLSDTEALSVQRLMDMGFERPACLQALAETGSVTEAMEMLLAERDLAGQNADRAAMMNRFGVLAEADGDGADPWVDVMLGVNNMIGGGMGAAVNEEPEALIAQAVLRRRGLAADGAAPDAAAAAAAAGAPGEAADAAAAAAAPAAAPPPVPPAPPAAAAAVGGDEGTPGPSTPAEELANKEVNLEWDSVVSKTTTEWIPLMLRLATSKKRLPTENKNVYHVADLTNAVWRFASDDWKRDHLLKQILREEIVSRIAKLRLNPTEETSFEIGTYLHFACLIFQSMAADYIKVLSEGASIVTMLLDLVDYAASNMDLNEYTVSTTISPTLLWLEMYDKYTHHIRRVETYSKCEQPLVFSFFSFEDRYNASRSKWQQYTPAACKKLTKAFLAGEQSVPVKNGRRDYVVDMIDMVQSQEGSTDRLHVSVMLAESDIEKIDIDEFLAVEKSSVFSEVETARMVNVLVALLSKCHIASYGAHGALELLVRITRDEAVAQHFVTNGGLEAMMKVRGQPVRYSESLFTQLVRQCIEDDALMTKLYDQFVRQACSKGVKPSQSPRWQSPPFSKDAFHVLSYLTHTATRSPLHYYKSLLKCVRLDKNGVLTTADSRKEQEKADEAMRAKAEGRTIEPTPVAPPTPAPAAVPALTVTAAATGPNATPTTKAVTFADEPEIQKKEKEPYAGPGLAIVEMLLQEALSGDWSTRDDKEEEEGEEEQTKTRAGLVFRLFNKSTLLYTLAELVRCYPFVALALTELKDKETGASVMSILMDRYSDPTIEKDTSNALHVLLVTFAMMSNQKANENLLNDMKSCLVGFAANPEAHTNVHIKIAEMAVILCSMMTSCPMQSNKRDNPHPPGSVAHAAHAAAQPPVVVTNSIAKLAVKKKILNELIRCATRLVLSKRESMDTMNHVIRAIDELTKTCNILVQPSPISAIPALATTRDGRLMQNLNELFTMQNITMDGTGAPQATLRRVDVAPNGDMTEAVVQIDVNGLDAAGLESMMERVNAAVEIATREVDRRQREGEVPGGVARVHVHMAHGVPAAAAADGERMVDPEEGAQPGEPDLVDLDEMRSASSEDEDDHPEMMDQDHEGGGAMMEEDGEEEEDDDDDDDDDDGPEEHDHYEDGYEDEHPDADVLEEGDDDEDDDEDDDGDEEEEDEEEAAREDERERAQHALASASAGGEEGEGERTAEDEGESENEVDEDDDDDDDPFGAFEHISYLERDAARIFMDMDTMRGQINNDWGQFGRGEFGGWGRDLHELFSLGGIGGGPGGVGGIVGGAGGFDPFGGAPRAIARWDQSPERTARATAAVHPLLQRPGGVPEMTEQERVVQSFARQRASGQLRPAEVGRVGGTGLESHRQRLHLIRQNAVRRGRDGTAARTDADFRRLLDMTAGRGGGAELAGLAPVGGLHHSWRALDPIYDEMYPGGFGGGGVGRDEDNQARHNTRLLQESTPSTMERFRESGRVMDDSHGAILATIINSIVYYKYKKEEAEVRQKVADLEKAKKDEAEKERKEKEEKEKAERAAAAAAAAAAEPPADTIEGEAAMEVADGAPTAAVAAASDDQGGAMETDEPVEQQAQPAAAAAAAEESMDTSSPPTGTVAIVPPVVSPDSPSGENSNGGSSTGATMGDETSMSGDALQLQPPTLEPMQPIDPAAAVEQPAAEAAAPAAAAADPLQPELQVVPEEYRGILGVDTLPAGVDAAFLAALPDDMRAEVLRDHERQQRAQAATAARAAAVAAPAAAPAAADGTPAPATGAAASAPGIEPLDPEFLSALPPELQIEIIEQHERAVRAANQAAAAAAAPPVAPQAEDPAEVIRSLPPTLRAQVLADADDTVLNVLPPELAEEARRLRNERGAHAARLAALAGERDFQRHAGRMVVRAPGGTARMGAAGRAAAIAAHQAQSGVGHLAGSTVTASTKGVQMLDRDALSSLVVMFFADARINQARLQRTLRDLCAHKGTCDYLIYALLAILKQISVNKHSEEEGEQSSDSKSWTDSITVSGVGHNERVVKITKDGEVSIHPLHAPTVAKNVVDLLVQIARSYPGHFVPHVLRKETAKPESLVPIPPFEHFWQTVYGYTTSKAGVCAKDGLAEHKVDTLEESPLAYVMELLQSETLKAAPGLNEKLLKLVYVIVQTLPDDTLARLKRDGGAVSDETPLCGQLKLVCGLLTSGTCSPDALNDGRLLLVEAMRAMNFRTTASIYEMLVTRIEKLGRELEPQVASMLAELSEVPEGSGPTTSVKGKYDSDLSREQRRRTEMERENMFYALHTIRNDQRATGIISTCPELQVPSARALQEKGGVQSALLSALQTVCKVRDTLSLLMADRKKRRTDEAQKKLDKAKKEWDDKKKKEERAAIAAAAAATAAVAAGMEAMADADATAAAAAPATDATAPAAMETSPPAAAADAPAVAVAAPSADATPTTSAAATPAAPPSTPACNEEGEQPPKLEDFMEEEKGEPIPELKLSAQLTALEGLWTVLSDCLQRLGKAADAHAILVLQPAAEAFFLVHAVTAEKAREAAAIREQAAAAAAPVAAGAAPVAHSISVDASDEDTTKLLHFAEKHRSVLNQVLRQNQASLTDGPFAVLAACPKLLDFDVKRTHFRKQLSKMDDRQRYRRDDVPLRVRRAHIFSDSFRELFRLRGSDWKSRFYIMFEGEEGQDAGGLLREWFSVITREVFNPNYALFITAPGDRSTYMINKASYINPEHLDYFKFVGRIIAKAIHDNKLLDCYFTRAFYKHILNLPVKYQDLESEDPEFYKSLEFLLNNPVEAMGMDITFTLEVEEFGVISTRPLKEGGAEMLVTDENKEEYVRLVCQMKMTSSIRRQLDSFLDGFYEVIPKQLIAMFNEQELELLISGLPDVDIDDLAANTEYRSYNKNSREIQWFWRALRSFESEDRAKFLQFVTGTSKVPLNGFGSLEGMNGAQKFSIHQDSRGGNRLPAAHTCFNQLDLPVYDSYEKLREALLLAIRECTEGFGFA